MFYDVNVNMQASSVEWEIILFHSIPTCIFAAFLVPKLLSLGLWKRSKFLNEKVVNGSEYEPLLGSQTETSQQRLVSDEESRWELVPENDASSSDHHDSGDKREGLWMYVTMIIALCIHLLLLCLPSVVDYIHMSSSNRHFLLYWIDDMFPSMESVIIMILYIWSCLPPLGSPSRNRIILTLEKQNRQKLHYFLIIYWASRVLILAVYLTQSHLNRPGTLSHTPLLISQIFLLLTSTTIAFCISPEKLRRRRIDGLEPCPESESTLYSQWTFSWLNGLMKVGACRPLQKSDMWQIQDEQLMTWNIDEYHEFQTSVQHATLGRSIIHLIRHIMGLQFLYQLLGILFTYAGPAMLNRLINSLQKEVNNMYEAFIFLLAMLILSFLKSTCEGQANLLGLKMGMRSRNILTSLIYQKALKRPASFVSPDEESGKNAKDQKSKSPATAGKVVNLMAVDTVKVGDFLGSAFAPVITFLQIVTCIAGLTYLLGWSALVGVAVMVAMMTVGVPFARSLKGVSYDLMKKRDTRTNLMNEILQGIRAIKFYAWEDQFLDKLLKLRQKETDALRIALISAMANRMLWFSTRAVVSLLTFLVYTKIAGYELTPSVAFTSLALFNMLKQPLQNFPDTLVDLIEAWVSYTRVREFLAEDELSDPLDRSANMDLIGFENASFSWDHSSKSNIPLDNNFTLKSIDTFFPQGELSVIIGATGSGKSSLLMALLGEMKRLNGKRLLPSHVAYAAQSAWLANATVRDNITFGEPWDPVRYRKVVHACALVRDFEQLDGGDMTEIGEKGINLSGGQKQRISLARACYSSAPVILMDDPLSAVDAPTAKHIFEYCILGLLKERTRILVTNAVSLCLPRADHVVMMEEGCISYEGNVKNLFVQLNKMQAEYLTGFQQAIQELESMIREEQSSIQELPTITEAELFELFGRALSKEEALQKQREAKLIKEEGMARGVVDWEVYKLYYNAMGGHRFFAIMLFGCALNHGFMIGKDNWVRIWTDAYKRNESNLGVSKVMEFYVPPLGDASSAFHAFFAYATPSWGLFSTFQTWQSFDFKSNSVNLDYYLSIYGFLSFMTIIAIIIRVYYRISGTVDAGKNIHEMMLRQILRAPMRFFDTTPLGRIMNRFTKDTSAADKEVGQGAGNSLFQLVYTAFVLGMVAFTVPAFILAMIPTAWMYSRICRFYMETSRSLKRLDSVSKSPIFSHFSESINGVITVRAFNAIDRFVHSNTQKVDNFNRVNYLLSVSKFWLSLRVQLLGAVIVFSAGLFFIFFGVNAGLAGLCLTLTMTLTDTLMFLVNNLSTLDMSMNSVERMYEYIHIEQEAPAIIEDSRPPKNWPVEGKVEIQDLVLSYAPGLPPVLKGISVQFNPREKIGVVGRTGAGKSTLSLAFFRFMEPISGTIIIDDVDIRNIGLSDLRSGLTIIPQDPILFSGTVRYNLDPFGVLDDATLWMALKRSHLVDIPTSSSASVSSTSGLDSETCVSVGERESLRESDNGSSVFDPVEEEVTRSEVGTEVDIETWSGSQEGRLTRISLDTVVQEGGANFSQGQRQLLCLARALARRSRVIILDEATASVDAETDARIQDTIRSEFGDSTVITIAHRLKTVMDYDKILVLDHGSVAEFGSPHELLTSSRGLFRSMCEETGEFSALELIASSTSAAKQCAELIE